MGLSFPSWAVRENYLQPHRSDLWCTFPLGKEGLCPLHHPTHPENHLQLPTSDSGTEQPAKKLSTHFNSSLTGFCWGQLHLAGSRAGDSPPDLAEAAEPQELCRTSTAHIWVPLHKDSAIGSETQPLQVPLLMRCNTHHYKGITTITVIF